MDARPASAEVLRQILRSGLALPRGRRRARRRRATCGSPRGWGPRLCYDDGVGIKPTGLAAWTPDEIAAGRRWVQTWRDAGPELERIRREELRRLDVRHTIALLCGPADYTTPPRAPKPTSGLVTQQRWFQKLHQR